MIRIEEWSKAKARRVIDGWDFSKEEADAFRLWIRRASIIWVGVIEDELIGMLGFVLPSLVSDSPYLWLFSTNSVKGNEFMFVRQSRVVVQRILAQYPVIYGHVAADNPSGIRWLKWLGATLGEPEGKLIRFMIRRT